MISKGLNDDLSKPCTVKTVKFLAISETSKMRWYVMFAVGLGRTKSWDLCFWCKKVRDCKSRGTVYRNPQNRNLMAPPPQTTQLLLDMWSYKTIWSNHLNQGEI
jgi:hypothetical protein